MQQPKKPNIIYILADDMGYGDVSANNESCPFETPSLDSLAKHGLRFTDAHASSAVCTPSRYSIMTGRYNWRSALKEGVLGGYSSPLSPKAVPQLPPCSGSAATARPPLANGIWA